LVFVSALPSPLFHRSDRRVAVYVPPAAKRAENPHGGAGRIRSGALHIVPCNEKLTIRIKNIRQWNCVVALFP
jgi:hypothetical protein